MNERKTGMKKRNRAAEEQKREDDQIDFIKHHHKKLFQCITKDYDIGRQLGKGRAGVVYEVIHKHSNPRKEYAAKITRIKKNDGVFDREVRTMIRFQQVGLGVDVICTCKIDIGDPDTDTFINRGNGIARLYGIIVMQKVEGVLDRFLRDDTQLSRDAMKDVGRQLINIIQTMQREHISHNDLHFANIGYFHNRDKILLKIIDMGMGHDERSFTDISLLNIGAMFFKNDYSHTKLQAYLRDHIWPKFKEMFHDNRLCNIKSDHKTIYDRYLTLYYKWINLHKPKTVVGDPESQLLVEIVKKATCVEKDYITEDNPLVKNRMVAIRSKAYGRDATIDKYSTLKYFTSLKDWQHESEFFKQYMKALHGMNTDKLTCEVTVNHIPYGVMIMDAIDGSLDEYLQARQYDMTEEEFDQLIDGITQLLEYLSGEAQFSYGNLNLNRIGYCYSKNKPLELRLFDFSTALMSQDTDKTVLEVLTLGKSLNKSGRGYRILKERGWPVWKTYAPTNNTVQKDKFKEFTNEWNARRQALQNSQK